MDQLDPQSETRFIITTDGDILGQYTDENREMIRRFHACLNACEGISTEDLEQGIIQDMCRIMSEVAPILETKTRAAG